MDEWKPAGPGAWKRTVGDLEGSLWEVASRKGKFQWQVVSKDFMRTWSGEDWYDSREEAMADADAALNR